MRPPFELPNLLLDIALREVGDADARPTDRILAAAVSELALAEVVLDEGRVTKVLLAAGRSLDRPAIAVPLIRALGRYLPADTLGAPLGRLARTCLERGHLGVLHEVCLVLLGHDVTFAVVESAWVEAAVRWALGRQWDAVNVAGVLIDAWLGRRSEVDEWLRETVRAQPPILRSRFLSDADRLRLHLDAPTEFGWLLLAGREARRMTWPTVQPHQRADVLSSLEKAIEAVPERARRVVLAGWLVDLAAS